jgi:predicted negative regulator of RcsB-dependent stress response
MRAKEKEKPEPDPLVHFLGQVKPFLMKNGLHLLLFVCLVAVGILTYRIFTLRHSTQTLKQWDAVDDFSESVAALYGPQIAASQRKLSIQQCEALVQKGQATTATPWLLLKLASLYAGNDQWSAAADAYKRLITEYPDGAAAGAAREALPAALEELGTYGEAASAYEELAQGGRAGFLVDAGRAREIAGDLKGAEADYRKALDGDIAEGTRRLVRRRLAELAQGRPLGVPPKIKPPEPAPALPAAAQAQPGPQPVGEEAAVPAETPVAPAIPEPAPMAPAGHPQPAAPLEAGS